MVTFLTKRYNDSEIRRVIPMQSSVPAHEILLDAWLHDRSIEAFLRKLL